MSYSKRNRVTGFPLCSVFSHGLNPGADIADDEWIRLKLDIDETRVRVSVNGKEEFAPTDLKAVPEAGGIGLWVGRGTEGYFSDLRIIPR